jgi:hypothetical protein
MDPDGDPTRDQINEMVINIHDHSPPKEYDEEKKKW